jgi:hypothetical protein
MTPGLVPRLNVLQPPASWVPGQVYFRSRQLPVPNQQLQLAPPLKNIVEQPSIFYVKSIQVRLTTYRLNFHHLHTSIE